MGVFRATTGSPRYLWIEVLLGGHSLTVHRKVNKYNVPWPANLTVFLGTALLVLFPLASTIALNVIISCALAALLMAYLICICVLVDARLRSESVDDIKMDDSNFPLPQWVVWVANVIAIAFLVVATILLAFPAAPHPDAASMNWTCVILPGIVGFALTWYYLLGGKKNYIGPGEKFGMPTEEIALTSVTK